MSYENPRIEPTDSFQDAVFKMSDGNPGAITALMELAMNCPSVDPGAALGPLTPLLDFDMLDVYGSDIYVFFKEVCDRNVVNALGVLRAQQLGFIETSVIKQMIADGQNYKKADPAVIANCLTQVREFLPNFKR